jgi:hypothetical protein
MEEMKNKQMSSEKVLSKDGTLVDSRSQVVSVVQFIALLSVAIFAPAINIQAVTGTLVNSTLFISVALLGIPAAILIGIIPSVVSVATGALASPIAPMVPFIILSNSILALTFSKMRKKSYWRSVVAASFVKFAFLSVASSFVIGYFVSEKVAAKIALLMSYPQLLTALSGGVLAYVVLGAMKRSEKE